MTERYQRQGQADLITDDGFQIEANVWKVVPSGDDSEVFKDAMEDIFTEIQSDLEEVKGSFERDMGQLELTDEVIEGIRLGLLRAERW